MFRGPETESDASDQWRDPESENNGFFFFFLSGMNFRAEIRSPLCNSRNSNTGCTNLRK